MKKICVFCIGAILSLLASCGPNNISSNYNGKEIKNITLKDQDFQYHYITGDFFNSPEKIILNIVYADGTSEEKALEASMISRDTKERLDNNKAGTYGNISNLQIYGKYEISDCISYTVGNAENKVLIYVSGVNVAEQTIKFGEPLVIPSSINLNDIKPPFESDYYYEKCSGFGNDNKYFDANHIYSDTEVFPQFTRYKVFSITNLEGKEIYSEEIEYEYDKNLSSYVPLGIPNLEAYLRNKIDSVLELNGVNHINYYDDVYHYEGSYYYGNTMYKDIKVMPVLNSQYYYTVNFYDYPNKNLVTSIKVDEGKMIDEKDFPVVSTDDYYDETHHYYLSDYWDYYEDGNFYPFNDATDIYKNYNVYQKGDSIPYYTVNFYNGFNEVVYTFKVNEDSYIKEDIDLRLFESADMEFYGFDKDYEGIKIEENLDVHALYTYNENDYVILKNNTDKTCTILEYTGEETSITIPSSFGDYKVTKIESDALKNSNVEEVVIPNSVKECFYLGIESFKKIELPLHLFECFDKAEEVIVHKGEATKIPNGFDAKLKQTKILRFADDIDYALFRSSSSQPLNGMSALEELECLGDTSLFYLFGTTSFDNAYQVEGMYYIPTSLKKVTIIKGSICDSFATGCYLIEEVEIKNHESTTQIGNNAFMGLTRVKNLVVPDSVLVIGNRAFSEMTSLNYIILGKNTHNIYQRAFENCTALTSIGLDYIEVDGLTGWYKAGTNPGDLEKVSWTSAPDLATKLTGDWVQYSISWIGYNA